MGDGGGVTDGVGAGVGVAVGAGAVPDFSHWASAEICAELRTEEYAGISSGPEAMSLLIWATVRLASAEVVSAGPLPLCRFTP